jgi:isoleucyl-tRNA synthetase
LWALHQTGLLIEEVSDALEKFEIHRAVQIINRFCSGILSSTYHDIIKDRLYTLHPDDPVRRSSQTAIHMIFEVLIRIIGPITPFTADEAWSYRKSGSPLCEDALVLQDWPQSYEVDAENQSVLDMIAILQFKESHLNDALEGLRSKKEIGQSLDAEVEICLSAEHELWPIFNRLKSDLSEIFIVSSVILTEGSGSEALQVLARHAPGERCPRSWRWVPELVEVNRWGKVSPRCAEVLAKLA